MNKFLKNYKNMHFLGSSKLLVLVLILMMFSSCEKAIEPEFPDFLISEESVFEDASTANAAIANIYAGLRDISPVNGSSSGISALLGLYADELDYYRSISPIDYAFYNHIVLPNNTALTDFWNSSYSLIYNANAILEGLENSPLSDSEKTPLLGEALFLRAYLHFYLAQLFGDIPYIKTTDYKSNASVSRMPLETVYLEMEKDLIQAKGLLNDMDNSGERTRVSKGVASAMLARLYLFTKQWEKAFTESNSLIFNGSYGWQLDLNHVFLKESSSTIWQLKPEFEGAGTKEGETFIFDFGPPSLYALNDNFILDFEPGDLRLETWTREVSDGTNSWFHPYKYKQNMFGASSTEYSILFRLAEQYLIHAVSALELGNLQEAKSNIDVIRLRAGLEPTTANSPEECRNELLHQWKYEFFSELGHRWFDLKRTGKAGPVLSPLKLGWKATDTLLPIPASELILNPNLNPQNAGY